MRRSPCVSYFKPYLSSVLRTYMPCLPTRAMKAPSGEQWVHEVKHDGYRLQARKVDGRVRLYTKQGYDWSKNIRSFPKRCADCEQPRWYSTARPCASQMA